MDKVAMYKEHIEKIAGIKQIQRVLEAEGKAAKPRLLDKLNVTKEQATDMAEKLKDKKKIRQIGLENKSYMDTHTVDGTNKNLTRVFEGTGALPESPMVSMHTRGMDPNNYNLIKSLRTKLIHTDKGVINKATKDGVNKANMNDVVARANEASKVNNSHFHGKKLDYDVTMAPKRNTDTVAVRDTYERGAEDSKTLLKGKEQHYFTGKDNSYVKGINSLSKGDGVWATPHPEVADYYGNHVFKFKNTDELTKGGSPRSHAHIGEDTRGMSERAVSKMEPKTDLNDYERVLNYDHKAFKNNFEDVYSKSRHSDYAAHDGQILRKPALFTSTGKDREVAMKKFKNFNE